jgi:hypothetical protein
MKHLPSRARMLGLAFTFALSVVSVSAIPASAQDNGPVDPGVRCAAKIGPGEYDFYLPGAKVTDKDGNHWVCGPDGMWFKDYSALTRPPLVRLTASLISRATATVRG